MALINESLRNYGGERDGYPDPKETAY